MNSSYLFRINATLRISRVSDPKPYTLSPHMLRGCRREAAYEARGMDSSYLFRINATLRISTVSNPKPYTLRSYCAAAGARQRTRRAAWTRRTCSASPPRSELVRFLTLNPMP